jgi:spermidine synthase
MLPATFCAGMTLPLITHLLLGRGYGERSIGTVYAANTVGAILGVGFAMNVGMPLLGIRNALAFAATLDLGLGVLLLAMLGGPARGPARIAAALGVAAVAATLAFVHLDPYQMASGVYRYGRATLARTNAMLFHKDGKTATINLVATPEGRVSIMTNGKPDAAINMRGTDAAPDEVTMVLAAALPLSARPQARIAANIGMGSGLTTSTLLASERIAGVDTIEIESAIVEAAAGYKPRVARAYEDPRSQLHIEDAKSYFAANQRRYDIIVSEPSNPWVSGVASLFSQEFYATIRHYLSADGVLVQWLQAYETDIEIIASVVNALGQQFGNYVIFATDNANLLIMATNGGTLDDMSAHVFATPPLAAELARVGVNDRDDLGLHRIGDRALLEPLFTSFRVPANSDYFPFVDQRAARARFLNRDAMALIQLADAPVPLLDMLDARRAPIPLSVTPRASNLQAQARLRALALLNGVTATQDELADPVEPHLRVHVDVLASPVTECTARWRGTWLDSLFRVGVSGAVHLREAELDALWSHLSAHACATGAQGRDRSWLELIEAVTRRDATGMAAIAQLLLEGDSVAWPDERQGYLIAAAMLGRLADHDAQGALGIWERHGASRWSPADVNLVLRLMTALAIDRSAR